MTGSKLRLLAWLLPLLVAGGLWIRLHTLRAESQALATLPPSPVVLVPTATTPTPAPRPAPVSDEAQSVARLRQELSQLRARIVTREQQLRSATPTPKPHNITEDFLPAEAWRDAGTDTPAALIETALWAGAGGDVGRMASLLTFDADGLAAANALLDRLPADLRPPGADSRALIALLSTDAVPLTAAKLGGDFPLENGEHILVLQLTAPDDAPRGPHWRNVKLTARQDPASAEWRFVVPPSAVGSFARQLGLSAATATPGTTAPAPGP